VIEKIARNATCEAVALAIAEDILEAQYASSDSEEKYRESPKLCFDLPALLSPYIYAYLCVAAETQPLTRVLA
jgi:hypothetical protein